MSHEAHSYDVAVVGAGPAGTLAARTAAAAGLRVAVLDKAQFPRYKTCGGGLLGRARDLAGIDLAGAEERACHRLDVTLLDSGQRFSACREKPLVTMTMRASLDALLLDAATTAGATFLGGHALRALEQAGPQVRLEALGPGGPIALTAQAVVAADGANSPTATLAGFAPHRAAAPALEWEVRVPDEQLARFANAARFDFDVPPDGYAWVFPKRAHLSIGVLSARRGCRDLPGACARYIARLGLTPVSVERHGYVIPQRPRAEGLSRGRILLCGDAAGLADPVTLEGLSNAMLSGRLAGEAVLAGGFDSERTRRIYREMAEEAILPDLRAGAVLARLLYGHPRLRTALFRRHGQRFAETLTDIATGRRRYRDLVGRPSTYLKLLRL